jgi:hypothetical protein
MPSLDVNWHPDDKALEDCFGFGAKLADALLA